jgi:hypothetical protein
LSEVLKDFYRLATYQGTVDRTFAYVETAHLRRYMAGVAVGRSSGDRAAARAAPSRQRCPACRVPGQPASQTRRAPA